MVQETLRRELVRRLGIGRGGFVGQEVEVVKTLNGEQRAMKTSL